MAKAIATIGGYALAPGVSKNRRWYTAEHIRDAVKTAQERLARGDEPMVMLSHHDANDDSLRIAAGLREVSLTDDGRIRWRAAIPDTETGREIAALADSSDGQPAFLDGVSIRGRWTGKVRQVKAPDGGVAEQGEGLVIDGLDFTHKPGVPGARIDTFAWAKGGATETSESVLITESVEEARVTITEETDSAQIASPVLREALLAVFGAPAPEVEEASPALSKRDSGLKGAGRVWADPGYQADKKQRYDLSTRQNAKSAWSYVNQKDNAAKYTPAQLKRVKGRIKAALRKFGVTVAAEGWSIDPPFQVTEALAEMMGDPSCAGSYSLSATNGPTTVTVCSYGLDPADLGVLLDAACCAATAALCTLDPDMDADIDVPGADAEDTDRDMADDSDQADNGDGVEDLVRRLMASIRGESAEPLEDVLAEARALRDGETEVTETSPQDPAPDPAAADEGTEAPVTETTTTEAAGTATAAPSFTQADVSAAVSAALEQAEAARRAKKAAKKARAAEAAPASPAPVTESAPAQSEEDRINAIVEAQLAKAGVKPVTETDDERIARLAEARVTERLQQLTAAGQGPARKGLVTEHTAARASGDGTGNLPVDGDGNALPMERWSEPQRRAVGAALDQYVMGARALPAE